MDRLAWHFDFHSHRAIRINHDPDVAGIARSLRENGVEEIITFAKGHDGFACYPSRIGTPHPRMKGDAFGDVVSACRKEGIRVLAYVSFGMDGEAGRKHPEWVQVTEKGPVTNEDWFISICPFTPYMDELMLPMIEEIIEGYPVDGFFFDTMGAMGVCYCAWCEKEFRQCHGVPIPRHAGDALWGTYGRFRHERSFRMLGQVGSFITARIPAAKVGFNQVGTVWYPERMPAGISCLTMGRLADVASRMKTEYPDKDSKPVPDILLLHGPGTMYRKDMGRFAVSREGLAPLAGAHRLLLDAGANFSVVAEDFLPAHLDGCGMLVLPEMSALNASTGRVVLDYVAKGGRVLIVGGVPETGDGVLDGIGACTETTPFQDHVYLPGWADENGSDPVLVRGDFHAVKLAEASCVVEALVPYDCSHGIRFGWGIGPASDSPSGIPVLTRRRLGDGEVWFLAARLFSDYGCSGNWTHIRWFARLLREILPEPRVQVVSESGCVEAIGHANGKTTWVFLINHGGDQMVLPGGWSRVLFPLPAYPVVLRVRDAAGRSPVSVASGDCPVSWKRNGPVVETPLVMDCIWRVVRVDWEGARCGKSV